MPTAKTILTLKDAEELAAQRQRGGFIPGEATRRDTYAHMDHLFDNLLLSLEINHTILHPDGTEEEINIEQPVAACSDR